MTTPLVAVIAKYTDEPFVLNMITSVARHLRFEKIFADGHTEPADRDLPAEKIVSWLDQRGFIRCGALIGDDEDVAVVWILAAEHANGKTPESYSRAVGQKLQSATITFYPSDDKRPAHLGSEVAGWATKRARARHPYEQRNLAIEKFDPQRRLKTYGLA